MNVYFPKSLIVLTSIGLSACGGDGGEFVPPAQGANGLEYGQPGQQLSDAEGNTVTMRSAGLQDGSPVGISDGFITIDAGFVTAAASAKNGTVQIFGEDVVIINGEGTLSNGQTVTINLDPSRAGTYAGALEVISYGSLQAGVASPFDGENHSVFGFETNPSTISGRTSGSVDYVGDFVGSGIARDQAGNIVGTYGTEIEGGMTISVDFERDVASGSIDASYQAGVLTVDVPFVLAETALDSNGFAGTLTCGAGCTSASELDATFYGPNADELGGVVAVDVTQDVGGANQQFQGVGTFVITPQVQ